MVLTNAMKTPPTKKPYSPPRLRTETIKAPTLLTVTCVDGEIECGGTCIPAGDPC